MKRITVILSILVFALATTGLAMADAFTFSFSGGGQAGSGTVFDANEGGGVWSITNAIGTIDGSAVTGVAPCVYPATCGPIGTGTTWDNVLYYPAAVTFPNTGPANVDWQGLLFTLANGDFLNLYYYDNQSQGADICGGLGYCASLLDANGNPISAGVVSATFAPVPTTPEPSSLVLFGSGILGLAGILRRKLIG